VVDDERTNERTRVRRSALGATRIARAVVDECGTREPPRGVSFQSAPSPYG